MLSFSKCFDQFYQIQFAIGSNYTRNSFSSLDWQRSQYFKGHTFTMHCDWSLWVILGFGHFSFKVRHFHRWRKWHWPAVLIHQIKIPILLQISHRSIKSTLNNRFLPARFVGVLQNCMQLHGTSENRRSTQWISITVHSYSTQDNNFLLILRYSLYTCKSKGQV